MQSIRRLLMPSRVAHAHCDVPCGIYDPDQARIEAESCYKILEKYHASSDEVFKERCIIVKEQRADLAKHHIDVLWHDYFKPEHVQKYPNLHELVWQAPQPGSKGKQSTDIAGAKKLIALIDKIRDSVKQLGGREQPRGEEALTGSLPHSVGMDTLFRYDARGLARNAATAVNSCGLAERPSGMILRNSS